MRVISLTSIPPRFSTIGPVLESICALGADEVRLYLPQRYRRFPDWNGDLPKLPATALIYRTETDLGPATKVLPACRELLGEDAQILFCDDDCIPTAGWARRLFALQAKRSDQVVAGYVRPSYVAYDRPREGVQAKQLPIQYDFSYRLSRLLHRLWGTRILHRRPFIIPGYGDVLFGVGGAVVRPEFFDEQAFDIPEIAWPVDDIWLSAMLARAGIQIYCPWLLPLPRQHSAPQADALANAEFLGKARQTLNLEASRYCQQKFGIWQ